MIVYQFFSWVLTDSSNTTNSPYQLLLLSSQNHVFPSYMGIRDLFFLDFLSIPYVIMGCDSAWLDQPTVFSYSRLYLMCLVSERIPLILNFN